MDKKNNCELREIKFDDLTTLGVTNTHPIVTQDNKISAAKELAEGDNVSTTIRVKEVSSNLLAGINQSSDDSEGQNNEIKVYNLALGSREVVEVIRLSLLASLNYWDVLTEHIEKNCQCDVNTLPRMEPRIGYELANYLTERLLTTLKAHGENSFLGLEPREHIFFTNNVATGSYTLQNLLVGYGYPNEFVNIDSLEH